MSNFPQKRSVNVAVAGKRSHDLSHCHITTTDFGRMKPIELRYMVPGDEFHANITNETRVLSNMPSPTYGKFDLVYRAFFVPLNHIWHPFYDYISNQQGILDASFTDISNPPFTTMEILTDMFIDDEFGLTDVVSNPTSQSEYDFKLRVVSVDTYYKFTNKGRLVYDFITASGLNFNFGFDRTKVNILPFVAFWKAYFDWIVPSRFIRNHENNINLMIQDFDRQDMDSPIDKGTLFSMLFQEPLCYYEDDLFNTLTEYPFTGVDEQDNYYINSPNPDNALFNVTSIYDAGSSSEGAILNAGAVAVQNPNSYLNSFGMYTLQTLGKLQDLLNRKLIAGSKVQDWLLSEFGMRPSTDALHLSTYLGSQRNTLAINDIISTSDTTGVNGVGLGSYGGYVRGRDLFDFSYKADEHGYFMITFELVPRTNYFQGFTPEFSMLDRFDFFQPEFDNQQGQPFGFGDLFADSKGNETHQTIGTPFGFGLQYSRLKYATDVVSGDFRNRFGLSMKSWFMVRDMEKYARSSSDVQFIDEEFCLVKSKYQDWNYIFADTNSDKDHFLSIFYFNMPCRRPMLSIAEGFEPVYKNSGKDVSLNFSGSVK